MAKISLVNLLSFQTKEYEIASTLLLTKTYHQAIFDQVICQNAGARQATHSTLTKAEVSGGGKKPLAQKHTGHARQGSIRNPHWVGGGVCFGPKPNKNYQLKFNAKASQLAFKSVFTSKINSQSLFALEDDFDPKKLHTRDFVKLIKFLKIEEKNILFIFDDKNDLAIVKARNIAKLEAKKWNQTSTNDLLKAKFIIVQMLALKKLLKVN